MKRMMILLFLILSIFIYPGVLAREQSAFTGQKGVVWHPWGAYSTQSAVRADATDMQNAGITYARTALSQSSNLSTYDMIVNTAVAHGININFDLQGAELASDQSAWVTWVQSVVNRYKASVHNWEVGNEEDLIIRNQTSDPIVFNRDVGLYVTHLQKTYQAIKAIQPTATVLLGGLSNAADNDPPLVNLFVNDMVANYQYVAASMDGFAYHPYADTPANAAGQMTKLAGKLAGTSFASVPLRVTEIGWFTGNIEAPGPSQVSTEQQKANNLTAVMPDLLSVGVHLPIYWYVLHETTDGITGSGYGLTLKNSSNPTVAAYKKAYYAYQAL
jgi:hypothetical protein